MSQTRLHWGILGTGNIANQFAEGVAAAKRSRVVAIASRTRGAAEGFAEDYAIPHAHGSYQALLEDDAIEAVYISLPNTLHCDWTCRALEAGKHVLCEKPLACTAAEAQQMIDTAQRCGRTLVEAFMYRSHPQTRAVLAAVRDGLIGQLRQIRLSFCFRITDTTDNIRFDPQLAGGALMDVGCYCTDFARLLAGREPQHAHAVACLHHAGVDEQTTGILDFGDNLLASFACAMTLQSDNTAYICGTDGYIAIPVPWKPPAHRAQYTLATMTPPRQEIARARQPAGQQVFEVDANLPLYALEADDFARTVLDNAPPAVTAEQSLGNMLLLDNLRQQVGLTDHADDAAPIQAQQPN